VSDNSDQDFNHDAEMRELKETAYFANFQLIKLFPYMIINTLFRIGVIGGLFFLISTEEHLPRAFLYVLFFYMLLEALELAQHYLSTARHKHIWY
jgi:hypothetical protein